jgi:hypothetical protein
MLVDGADYPIPQVMWLVSYASYYNPDYYPTLGYSFLSFAG